MMNKNASIKATQVLAKSKPELPLKAHIDDCLNIGYQLRMCIQCLPVKDKELFWNSVRTALICHDLGKAHSEFQKMLREMPNKWFHQRHELFSVFCVLNSSLPETLKSKILFPILIHHKDLQTLFSFVEKNYCIDEEEWMLDSELNYEGECEKLYYETITEIISSYDVCCNNQITNIDICRIIKDAIRNNASINSNAGFEQLLLTGALKQSDHLASAGIQELKKLNNHDFDFLHTFSLYAHQQDASKTSGNVILTAPTGSGKTETAFLWLEKQIIKKQGRVFYILPYTASINAMYERLDKDTNNSAKIGMVHSKLAQYIENKYSDEDSSLSYQDKRHIIDDFKTMVTPVRITTPFQLLKNLFGLKGFEKGLFEMSGGYYIFDEIHAYDVGTFAQIIVLLQLITQKLNASVFIMTATLPSFMKKEIESAIGQNSQIKADKQLYEAFNRHRVKVHGGTMFDSLSLIQDDINDGKKVLVVCNTVESAQKIYKALQSKRKLLIHGSFNANDRFHKEKQLSEENICLLVGTQAIEVSLDIDYDTIYTEPAPIDALIQRFGRVNRKRKKGLCVCNVFKERNKSDKYIYKDESVIDRTIDILKMMENKDNSTINEIELQSAVDYVFPDWNEESKKEFELIKSLFMNSLNSLKTGENSPNNEEDFYKQFDGRKVLPESLIEQYRHHIENVEFIKAEGLMISIREKRFMWMLRDGDIYKETLVYDSGKDRRSEEIVYVIKRKYDSYLGLQLSERDDRAFDNFL